MRFTIIAIGTRMPSWVESGYQEYARRLPRDFQLRMVELPLGSKGKSTPTSIAIAREGEQMLASIPRGDHVIALDAGGDSWSTEQFAARLGDWSMTHSNFCLLIGGPDGLSARCIERADRIWSLSKLTLPHPLVRIVVAEQLYRVWSLLNRHPYHK